MKRLLDRIAAHAAAHPTRPALRDAHGSLDYRALQQEIERLAGILGRCRVALLLDNSSAWVALDLAVMRAGGTVLPIPSFFSDEQVQHVLADARPQLIVTDRPERLGRLPGLASPEQLMIAHQRLAWLRLPDAAPPALPPDTAKLTYTSGTTGRPKGVCLSGAALAAQAIALSQAVGAGPADRGLSLLPLSTLLENLGVHAALYGGAEACVPDPANCGLHGSSGADPVRLMATLDRYRPTATILVPQLLKLMVEAIEAGLSCPPGLRFVAVGGAPVAASLITRARHAGLPAYEGYGLSEAGSVVSLNLPGSDRLGSAGRPLAWQRVRIAEDGEVLVAGNLFNGYLGDRGSAPREWPTGDLGHLDADGYLHVTGRKQSSYATAFGRNLAPEWVEGELLAGRAVLQAAVFGADRPYNVAVLVPHPRAGGSALAAAVADANRRLPDYARVRRWLVADQPFLPGNGLARAAGTPDRPAIAAAYAARIDQLYEDLPAHAPA